MAVPVSPTIQTQIANLYIAILGRNPEPAGFGYWCDVLANNNGTQAALNAIAEGFSKSPEFVGTYGGQTTSAAITLMYNNILNRAPDAPGLTYWTNYANNLITNTPGMTVANALALTGNQIITVAAANTGTADQTLINGKQTAAVAAGTTAPSTTVSLTTNIDTLNVGSNTTVIGTVQPAASADLQTLNPGDSIVGTGINNTLRVVDVSAAGAGLTPLAGVTMSGIQTLSVQNANGATTNTYNLANTTGVTTVQNANASGGTVNFTNLAAGTTVSVSGSGAAASTTTFSYATASSPVIVNLNGGLTTVQTLTGTSTATSATITSTGGVNGVATTGAAANAVLNLVTGATLTSLTVNAATNMRATLTAGNFSTLGAALTVSGAASSVNLGTAGVYQTINASGLTGGLTVNASSTLTSFVGGNGNDSLTNNAAGNAVIASTATINAGAGTDTLAATLVTAGNAAIFTGFEVLNTNGQTATLDVSLLTNSTITGVNLGGSGNGAAFSNLVMPSSGFTVTVSATNTNATTLGFTAASTAGTSDTVNINFTGTSGAAVAASTVTMQGIELVNISSGGISGTSNSITLAGNSIQTVTVTGTRALSLTIGDQALVGTATATTLTAVNASGMAPASATSGLTFIETAGSGAAGTVSSITITGSSANDSITVITTAGSAGNSVFGADTVNLSAGGNDTVVVTGAVSQLGTNTSTATAFGFTTISGINANDAITGIAVTAFNQTAVDVSAATSLNAALTLAATAGANDAGWFSYGGNTYILFDAAATAGFTATDVVVRLSGVVDLSDSTLGGGNTITIV